jgi:hypothetical protein
LPLLGYVRPPAPPPDNHGDGIGIALFAIAILVAAYYARDRKSRLMLLGTSAVLLTIAAAAFFAR